MKQLLLLNIIFIALSAPIQAETIKAIATDVRTTYVGFSDTAGGSTALTDAEIQSIISTDPEVAIYGIDATNYSVIDLDFGDNTAITGTGVDLAIFSLWSGYDYSFGLEAYGKDGGLLSSYNYDVNDSSIFSECEDGSCPTVVTTSINLFDKDALELGDNLELSYIRLFIGGELYNGSTGGTDAYSNFSLAGAFNVKSAVVPLPLSAVLFSSGLALLGWTGRRKKPCR